MVLLKRLLFVVAVLAACMLSACCARDWDNSDVEMFEIQAGLEKSYGEGANFYSFMGLTPSASLAEIRKAYRERSLEWHPDKNPDTPEVHRRFERLGLIHKILRDERRDRYNYFLTHGFPKWRGTGYFYERFRPSLAMVLPFIALVSVGVQLLLQKSQWRKTQKRIENLRRSALAAAWGPAFQTPVTSTKSVKPRPRPAQKKVQLPFHGFGELPPAPKESDIAAGNVDWDAEANKVREAMMAPPPDTDEDPLIVELVVFADGSVAINDPSTDEFVPIEPLPASQEPTVNSTWPFQLLRAFSKKGVEKSESEEAHSEPATEKTETPVEDLSGAVSATVSKKQAKRRKRASKAQ